MSETTRVGELSPPGRQENFLSYKEHDFSRLLQDREAKTEKTHAHRFAECLTWWA